MGRSRIKLIFNNKSDNNITPELLIKSVWVSTSLAFILTLPPLGTFLTVLQSGAGIAVATITGFGLHFVLLSFSGRISSVLSALVDHGDTSR
jgi:hypothetical protein